MKGAKQLRNMIYNILENSDAVSGVTLKNSPNSSTLLLDRADGKGRMTFHTLSGADFGFYFCKCSCVAGIRSQLRVKAIIDKLLYFWQK